MGRQVQAAHPPHLAGDHALEEGDVGPVAVLAIVTGAKVVKAAGGGEEGEGGAMAGQPFRSGRGPG